VTIGKTWYVFETIETRSELGAAEQISLNGRLSVLGKAVFQDDIVVTKKVNLGSDLSVLTAIYVGSCQSGAYQQRPFCAGYEFFPELVR
jgi:hypothetical protein